MRKQKGFSLIELLIVVAIILIIAAIAIPNLLRARIAANEASAVASVRTINTAEVAYNSTYQAVGYSNLLTDLGTGGIGVPCPAPPIATSACLLDSQLASGTKTGYQFSYAPGANNGFNVSYQIGADPLTLNQTGVRSFCSFEDAVVRYDASGAFGATCPPGTAALQ